MPEKSSQTQTADPLAFLDGYRHKTALRHALDGYEPKSIAEASNFTMECVSRAEALADVMTRYANHGAEFDLGSPAHSVIQWCTALMEDLLYLAYRPMMDWWDDEADLQRKGWQPPTGKGQR